jgi:hypothetical protein
MLAAVAEKYGRLKETASDEECAHHYRLAQAAKLIRLGKEIAETVG